MKKEELFLYFAVFNEIGIISQLSRHMIEQKMPDGLYQPHFIVLNYLTRVSDGASPTNMARAFQIAKTSLTHTLAGLARRDLVQVLPHKENGRSKQVWITDKGRKFREDVILSLEPDISAIAKEFPLVFMQPVLGHLVEVRKFLDSYRDVPNPQQLLVSKANGK